jgi:uncharacterized protein (DUF111 family)
MSEVETGGDTVALLETNLDDVTGEVLGYTRRQLFVAGALDVFTTPIQMKKDRPAVMLSVICAPEAAGALEAIIFNETQTFGIRRQRIQRTTRERMAYTVETDFGPIKGKVGWRGDEAAIYSPEYEDCARIASAHDIPLREVYMAAQIAFLIEQDEAEDHECDEDCIHDHDHDHDDDDHDHDHGHQHDHDHDHGRHHHHDHDHDHGHDDHRH